jgi:hypothetical protein
VNCAGKEHKHRSWNEVDPELVSCFADQLVQQQLRAQLGYTSTRAGLDCIVADSVVCMATRGVAVSKTASVIEDMRARHLQRRRYLYQLQAQACAAQPLFGKGNQMPKVRCALCSKSACCALPPHRSPV